MILQTIKCSAKNCENEYTEKRFNEGFPGWGHIQGVEDKETGENTAHLCPKHLQIARRLLNGLD